MCRYKNGPLLRSAADESCDMMTVHTYTSLAIKYKWSNETRASIGHVTQILNSRLVINRPISSLASRTGYTSK